MLILNDEDIKSIGTNWDQVIEVIRSASKIMNKNDFSQPVKPYLRFNNPDNRIIAMPAYIGGDIAMAGIKWIASFPNNVEKSIPRAHSVTILNEANTGIPLCMFQSSLLSGIRTAAVSGLVVIENMKRKRRTEDLSAGIIGLGPIGRLHLEMLQTRFDNQISKIYLYDLKSIDDLSVIQKNSNKIVVCNSWHEVLQKADICITCTVSKKPYIDTIPKKGSLHLNVSLRDYKPNFFKYVDLILVDNWEEVCRENTDIEIMHKSHGLIASQTYSIVDIISKDVLTSTEDNAVVMFNPMGMAVFDIAVANFYYKRLLKQPNIVNTGVI